MDYSKLFEEKYQETFQRLENFVNSEFKSSKEDDEDERDYLETYNEVRSKLENWKKQHFENSELKTNIEIFNYFTSKNNKVDFPDFLFPGVLERKTKKLFIEKHSEAEYSSFIEGLAENKAYQDIIDIVNNYDKYIDLVYQDKKWKPIDLSRFDQNYESAEYFLNLHKKIYPPSTQVKGRRKKDYSEEIENTKQQLKNFTEEEKIFLLKVFYEKILKSRKGMEKTEFIKFSQVISGMEDLSIFYKKAESAKSYNHLKQSNDHFLRMEGGKFFEILINKLDSIGLNTLKTEMKLIRSKP